MHGAEVGTDCIDGLRLVRPRRSSQACCDGTTKVPDLMENSVPARPVYVQRGKTHIGTCDEDRAEGIRSLSREELSVRAAHLNPRPPANASAQNYHLPRCGRLTEQ